MLLEVHSIVKLDWVNSRSWHLCQRKRYLNQPTNKSSYVNASPPEEKAEISMNVERRVVENKT